jgi:cytochrome c oxidase assembly factor CtaG
MKEQTKQIGKHIIYSLLILVLSYIIMSFALWDPNVSSWEIGERMGMLFTAILLIILDKVFCAIKSIVNADDDYDYDDEFLTEEEMEMRMKQEERYNQNQQRHE